MRVWVARDSDGEARLFIEDDPAWRKSTSCGGYWLGDSTDSLCDIAEELATELEVAPGHKQPIELTARPVGAAEGGEG